MNEVTQAHPILRGGIAPESAMVMARLRATVDGDEVSVAFAQEARAVLLRPRREAAELLAPRSA